MTIHRTADGDVAIIRIQRPDTRNSLTLAQMVELRTAFEEVASSSARCLLLIGFGSSFCAGRDLREVDLEGEDTEGVMTAVINPLLHTVRSLPVPSVAAVHGPALGLGLGLALSCDLVWAAENAVFGSPFRNFGGVPDSGAHYFLANRLGPHRAAELIFTGRLINGSEAASIGLVNRAVPAPALEHEALELCQQIASGPTAAFRATKQILREVHSFDAILQLEAKSMHAALKGADGREGLRALREKRAAKFSGL